MDYSALFISLKTASAAIVITFFLGLLAARGVIALKSSKIRILIDSLLTLPLVLPPTVVGFFLLLVFGVNRPIGRSILELFGVKIVFSWTATVIAAVAISFPLMYRAARGALEQVNPHYSMTARTLGLSERSIFWKITLPLAMPGVASGAVLAFARGLGEFGATAMIAGNIANRTRTLPLAIYSEVAAGNMSTAYNYVVIVMGIAFCVMILMNYFAVSHMPYTRKNKRLGDD